MKGISSKFNWATTTPKNSSTADDFSRKKMPVSPGDVFSCIPV